MKLVFSPTSECRDSTLDFGHWDISRRGSEGKRVGIQPRKRSSPPILSFPPSLPTYPRIRLITIVTIAEWLVYIIPEILETLNNIAVSQRVTLRSNNESVNRCSTNNRLWNLVFIKHNCVNSVFDTTSKLLLGIDKIGIKKISTIILWNRIQQIKFQWRTSLSTTKEGRKKGYSLKIHPRAGETSSRESLRKFTDYFKCSVTKFFHQGETLPPLSGGLWSSAVPLKLGHLEAWRIDPPPPLPPGLS